MGGGLACQFLLERRFAKMTSKNDRQYGQNPVPNRAPKRDGHDFSHITRNGTKPTIPPTTTASKNPNDKAR